MNTALCGVLIRTKKLLPPLYYTCSIMSFFLLRFIPTRQQHLKPIIVYINNLFVLIRAKAERICALLHRRIQDFLFDTYNLFLFYTLFQFLVKINITISMLDSCFHVYYSYSTIRIIIQFITFKIISVTAKTHPSQPT